VILEVRVLLIALLLFGSTGSAVCQVLCARPADLQAIADAQPAGAAMPDHAGCHEPGAPSPEPIPERPDGSCEEGCCTTLALATADPISGPGSVVAASPMPIGRDLGEVRAGSALLPEPPSPGRLKSPFQFRNPPLLI
jgi:hypothetical protein